MNEQYTGRILVIDDDQDYSDGMVAILKSYNYIVEQTFNIKQSILKLDEFNPEIILLDLRLGRENGMDILTEIKSRNHPAICILITAYSSVKSAISALRTGAYDYLQKPISPETLMNNINHCFDRIAMEKTIKKHQVELEATVQKRTAELLDSKEMYKSLTKLLPVGIMRIDSNNKCTFVNNRWKQLTGYKFCNNNNKLYNGCMCVCGNTEKTSVVNWNNFLNSSSPGEEFLGEKKIINNKVITWILFEAIKVDTGGCIVTAVDITKQKEFLPELMLIKQGLKHNE